MKLPNLADHASFPIQLFPKGFLSELTLNREALPFNNDDLTNLDRQISAFEKAQITPEIEKNLITKNELWASFAISKAENSQLSLAQAKQIFDDLAANPKYNFIREKLKEGKKLTICDHDRLEFLNILSTFREINRQKPILNSLTEKNILQIHAQLTQNMDIFQKYLSDFDVYRSGKFRNANNIVVGDYVPPDFSEIKPAIHTLIDFIKKNPTIENVAVFHTALYAVHPFANGNKRICRILEHMMFRAIGLNQKNLYATSYYYHLEKERYYKHLLASIERKNLNYFVAFIQEALFFSLISIVKTALEFNRQEFLAKAPNTRFKEICKPLIKQKSMQYKKLFKIARAHLQLAEQTFVNDLGKAVSQKILAKKEEGKNVYYSLALNQPGEKWYAQLLKFARSRLSYVPSEFEKTVES